jgi:uncharacterized protein YgbK (DUF1537 family)
MKERGTLQEIAREFLRRGFVAYGGAIAGIVLHALGII